MAVPVDPNYPPTPNPYTTQASSSPDWTKLIQQYMDPYQQMYEDQMAQLAAQMGAQQGFAQSNAGLNAEQLDILHKKAIYDIKNSMGSRMLTDSGESHYQINKENALYKIAKNLQSNSLMSYLSNLSNQLAMQKLSGLQNLQQQRMGLLQFLPSLYSSVPTSYLTQAYGTTASPAQQQGLGGWGTGWA